MASTRSSRRQTVVKREKPIIKKEIKDPVFDPQEPSSSIHAHMLLEESPKFFHTLKKEENELEPPLDTKEEALEHWDQQPSTSRFVEEEEPLDIFQVRKDEENLNEEIDEENEDSSSSSTASTVDNEEIEVAAKGKPKRSYKMGRQHPENFQCEVCNGVYSSAAGLKTHYRLHTGELPFKCEFCDEAFRYKDSLNRHKRTHTNDKGLQCRVCHKFYVDPICLRRHMKSHGVELPFACDLCDKTFVLKDRLKRHKKLHEMKNKALERKEFICKECGESFPSTGSLTRHSHQHSEQQFVCDTCGRHFTTKHYLWKHASMKSCEPPPNEIHKCTICNELIINFGPLLKHYKDVHGMDPMKAWKENFGKKE